jgi:hypothetical protein
MLPKSHAHFWFALWGVLLLGLITWGFYWQSGILFDRETRADFRAGKRPPGFLARGSLPEVISRPSGLLVSLALLTSILWSAGMLLLLAEGILSGKSVDYSQQATPVRFWLQVSGWGLALLVGIAVFSWATWSLITSPEDRVRLTATVFERMSRELDNLGAKPKVVLLLYVIAIVLGLLMVANAVVSGQILGWNLYYRSANPVDYWVQIGFWLAMTGWVSARFVQELRK